MRVALIGGLGHWGSNIYRILNTMNIQVVTVDLNQEYNRTVQDLSEDEIDACFIATPADTHYEIALHALTCGWDCFVEKPMCKSVEHAEILTAIAKRKKKILMVDHQYLYNPAVISMKQIIDCGGIGKLYYIYSRRLKLGRIRDDVDTLWNFAPRDISVFNYLVGSMPETVSCNGWSYVDSWKSDVIFMTLNYRNNVNCHVHVSWLDHNRVRDMVAFGDLRSLHFNDMIPKLELVNDKETFEVGIEHREPLVEAVYEFMKCVKTRCQPLTDGDNGVQVVKVLEAAQESMKNNGEVRQV